MSTDASPPASIRSRAARLLHLTRTGFRKSIDVTTGAIAHTALAVLLWRRGHQLISAKTAGSVARIGTGPDALILPKSQTVSARRLRHPKLSVALSDQRLGGWSLGVKTISYLEEEIGRVRPEFVVEFGSGISTVCLAQFMVEVNGPGPDRRVLSIDQSPEYAAKTLRLLERLGLAPYAAVVHSPLARRSIEGIETLCYVMPHGVDEFVGSRRIGLVLIDGPAAEGGARFGTLPIVRPLIRGTARFVLDDAFRDGELRIARQWHRLPYIHVEGIRAIDKGLLIGSIEGQRTAG